MNILIKGIDMPTSCENCFAYHSDESRNKGCFITMHIDTRDECQSIQTSCPLVKIHTTHGLVQGRLINEFEKKLREYIDSYEIPGAMQALYEALDDAQEYIEAEE